MKKILNHSAIILSLFYLTLFVIDKINSAMQFIENDITKALILVLAAVSTVNAIIAISADRKKRKRQLAKEAAKKKAKKSR